jgi:hypothetical protein
MTQQKQILKNWKVADMRRWARNQTPGKTGQEELEESSKITSL